MNKPALKAATRIVKEAFSAKGAHVSHTEALDLLAKLQGFEAWSQLSANAGKPKKAKREAVTTLEDVLRAHLDAVNLSEVPRFPRKDWVYQVGNDEAPNGYWEWASNALVLYAEDEYQSSLPVEFKVPMPVKVTLPDGTAATWSIQQNLTDRLGEPNFHDIEHKPAMAMLLADEGLLSKLLNLMYEETTFVVCKDKEYGLLFEFEYASQESEKLHASDWAELPTHKEAVTKLCSALTKLEQLFPGLSYCVPEEIHVHNDRPAGWLFMPLDKALTYDQCVEMDEVITAQMSM